MKKEFLMKGMTALALTLAVVGCSKETELFDANSKVQESATNFVNNVLGGRTVDPAQNWSTAEKVGVTVKSELSGTLKVYVSNPHGNVTAPMLTQTITAGTQQVAVSKPRDVKQLYASLVTADGAINVVRIENNTAFFKAPTAAPAASRSARRAPAAPTEDGWTFADAPTDDQFASQLPDTYVTDANANGGGQGVNIVIQSPVIDYLNLWNAGSNVYFPAGNWVLNGQYVGANSKVYLLPGANVTFNGEYNLNSTEAELYIAAGATFNPTNIAYNFKLYNRGTINTGNMSQYAAGLIYNEGTINATGAVSPKNNGSEIVNAGTLKAASMTIEGTGHVKNMGTATFTGDVVVNSNSCTWVNDGTFRCKNFTYQAGSTDVINNCKLIVDEMFLLQLGDTDKNCFAINAGGGVTTKDFHFSGPGYVKMAANSLFTVTGTATMDATKVDYGFWGPTSGDSYAVLKAKDIVTSNESQMYDITYGGNLYVACDSHFPNSYPGGENDPRPVIDLVGNAKIVNGQTNAPYTIPANGNCNDGYQGNTGGTSGGGTVIVEPTMHYYYAFEDLGTTDDFDFNDVILRVSAPVNGKSSVELVAAGGTLETYVTYGLGDNPAVMGAEVHTAMGENSISTMINTKNVDTTKFSIIGTINVSADDDMGNLPFGIKVTGNDGAVVRVQKSVSGNGKAPLVIVVSGDEEGKWFWPTERANIAVSYSGFGNWGAKVSENADWYKNPTGSVVSY